MALRPDLAIGLPLSETLFRLQQLVIAELLYCDETARLPKSEESLRQPGDLDDFETHGFASRPCDRFAFIGNPV